MVQRVADRVPALRAARRRQHGARQPRADAGSAESRVQSSTVAAPPGEPHSTMATATAPRGLLPMAASTAGCESASA